MAAKVGGYLGKFLAIVFTSIVAPVMVDLVVRDIHREPNKPNTAQVSSQEDMSRPLEELTPAIAPNWQQSQTFSCPLPAETETPSPSPSAEVVRVITQGVGRTPGEALQNAFRNALLQAITDRVDTSARARKNPEFFETLLRDSSSLIVGWQELGIKKEWRLKGTLYRQKVAVTVDCHLLADRLGSVPSSDWERLRQ